jgi:CheY-like chemotaxis protein
VAWGSTVLIVDDDAPIRMLIRHVLEEAGYTVVGEAANGMEGIERAAELQPDVITMDLDMPVLDGATATERLCADGCAPIVIVSGSESSELVGRALAGGARWHVAKRDLVTQLPRVVAALLS